MALRPLALTVFSRMNRVAELHFDALLSALMGAVDDPFWSQRFDRLARERDRTLHVAVMHEPFLSLLLDGTKTIESRFSVKRVRPFHGVQEGDVLALKRQSGPVVGVALVASASFYELNSAVLEDLRGRFAVQIAATDDDFWRQRAHTAYATLIDVVRPRALPAVVLRKRDRRGWASLDPAATFS